MPEKPKFDPNLFDGYLPAQKQQDDSHPVADFLGGALYDTPKNIIEGMLGLGKDIGQSALRGNTNVGSIAYDLAKQNAEAYEKAKQRGLNTPNPLLGLDPTGTAALLDNADNVSGARVAGRVLGNIGALYLGGKVFKGNKPLENPNAGGRLVKTPASDITGLFQTPEDVANNRNPTLKPVDIATPNGPVAVPSGLRVAPTPPPVGATVGRSAADLYNPEINGANAASFDKDSLAPGIAAKQQTAAPRLSMTQKVPADELDTQGVARTPERQVTSLNDSIKQANDIADVALKANKEEGKALTRAQRLEQAADLQRTASEMAEKARLEKIAEAKAKQDELIKQQQEAAANAPIMEPQPTIKEGSTIPSVDLDTLKKGRWGTEKEAIKAASGSGVPFQTKWIPDGGKKKWALVFGDSLKPTGQARITEPVPPAATPEAPEPETLEGATGSAKTAFVRHGDTDLNDAGRSGGEAIRGWLDVPLNDAGRDSAHDAGAALAKVNQVYPFDHIYTSDLSRAQETAQIIKQHLGQDVPITTMPELRPWNLGDLSGQPVKESLPIMQHLIDNPDTPAPNGESFNQFLQRYLPVVKQIHEDPSHNIVIGHTRTAAALDGLAKNGGEMPIPTDIFRTKHPLDPGGVMFIGDDWDTHFSKTPEQTVKDMFGDLPSPLGDKIQESLANVKPQTPSNQAPPTFTKGQEPLTRNFKLAKPKAGPPEGGTPPPPAGNPPAQATAAVEQAIMGKEPPPEPPPPPAPTPTPKGPKPKGGAPPAIANETPRKPVGAAPIVTKGEALPAPPQAPTGAPSAPRTPLTPSAFDMAVAQALGKKPEATVPNPPESPIGKMSRAEVDAVTRDEVKNWTDQELQQASARYPKDKRLQTIIKDEQTNRAATKLNAPIAGLPPTTKVVDLTPEQIEAVKAAKTPAPEPLQPQSPPLPATPPVDLKATLERMAKADAAYGPLKDAVKAGTATTDQLRAAGKELGEARAAHYAALKAAQDAGQPVTPEMMAPPTQPKVEGPTRPPGRPKKIAPEPEAPVAVAPETPAVPEIPDPRTPFDPSKLKNSQNVASNGSGDIIYRQGNNYYLEEGNNKGQYTQLGKFNNYQRDGYRQIADAKNLISSGENDKIFNDLQQAKIKKAAEDARINELNKTAPKAYTQTIDLTGIKNPKDIQSAIVSNLKDYQTQVQARMNELDTQNPSSAGMNQPVTIKFGNTSYTIGPDQVDKAIDLFSKGTGSMFNDLVGKKVPVSHSIPSSGGGGGVKPTIGLASQDLTITPDITEHPNVVGPSAAAEPINPKNSIRIAQTKTIPTNAKFASVQMDHVNGKNVATVYFSDAPDNLKALTSKQRDPGMRLVNEPQQLPKGKNWTDAIQTYASNNKIDPNDIKLAEVTGGSKGPFTGDESGGMDPELARQLAFHVAGSALGGAFGGLTASPGEEKRNALVGAMAGALTPWILKNPELVAKWRAQGMLSNPVTLGVKMLGDQGAALAEALEGSIGKADPEYGKNILRNFYSKQTLKKAIDTYKNPETSAQQAADYSNVPLLFRKGPLAVIPRALGAATEATQDAFMRAGLPYDTAKDLTYAGTPKTPALATIASLPSKGVLGKTIMPFARVATNLFEKGVNRTPLGLARLAKEEYQNPEAIRRILTEAGLGTGAVGAGYEMAPDSEDKSAVTGWKKRLGAAALGPYALPVELGMAMHDAKNKGILANMLKAAINTTSARMPLPDRLNAFDFARTTVIPKFLADAARFQDQQVNGIASRKTNKDVLDPFIADIPFARETLPQANTHLQQGELESYIKAIRALQKPQ